MSDLLSQMRHMASRSRLDRRATLQIPTEIMDNESGDAAQERLAKKRLVEAIQSQDNRPRVPSGHVRMESAALGHNLYEMEAGDVDAFLKKARSRIIKRSKHERSACCTKIGGILDQMMGPQDDANIGQQSKSPNDRGKKDPIGESTILTPEFHDTRCPALVEFHLDEGKKPFSFYIKKYASGPQFQAHKGDPKDKKKPFWKGKGLQGEGVVDEKWRDKAESTEGMESYTADALGDFMEALGGASSSVGQVRPGKVYASPLGYRPSGESYNTSMDKLGVGKGKTAGAFTKAVVKDRGEKDPIGEARGERAKALKGDFRTRHRALRGSGQHSPEGAARMAGIITHQRTRGGRPADLATRAPHLSKKNQAILRKYFGDDVNLDDVSATAQALMAFEAVGGSKGHSSTVGKATGQKVYYNDHSERPDNKAPGLRTGFSHGDARDRGKVDPPGEAWGRGKRIQGK